MLENQTLGISREIECNFIQRRLEPFEVGYKLRGMANNLGYDAPVRINRELHACHCVKVTNAKAHAPNCHAGPGH